MAHQMDIQVEGAGEAMVGSHHWGGVGNRGNSSLGEVSRGVGHVSSSSMVASAGGKVVSTSCSNGRLINRNNSSVGMADKCSVQVEGSRIARIAVGNNWSSVSNNRSSTVGGSKCIEVFSTGCGNCRLINWDHCSIGVTHL